MARLPSPGEDQGNWGAILNEFLKVSHNSDGTIKNVGVVGNKYQVSSGGIPEDDLSSDVQDKLNSIDSVSSVNTQSGAVVLDKTDIGLSNVDNTSDTNKPISNATQSALDNKENTGIAQALTDALDAAKVAKDGDTMTGDLTIENSDAELTGTIGASTAVQGGLVKPTGLQILRSYTQTVTPTDLSIVPVNVQIFAVLDDDHATGPKISAGSGLGAYGMVNVGGAVQYARTLTAFSLGPIAFQTQMFVGNTDGTDIGLAPGFNFVANNYYYANGATVTHNSNDTNLGGASFMDTTVFTGENGGTWDGTDNEYTTLHSGLILQNDVFLTRRMGVEIKDVNLTGGAELDEDIGIRIRRLTSGTSKNIGIHNRSTTVEEPWTVELDDAGDAINITSTTVSLNNTSGGTLTLTSTPTIADGEDGQRVTLVNVSSDDITLQDEASLGGGNLRLTQATRTLAESEALELVYSDTAGAWIEVGSSEIATEAAVQSAQADATQALSDAADKIPLSGGTTSGFITARQAGQNGEVGIGALTSLGGGVVITRNNVAHTNFQAIMAPGQIQLGLASVDAAPTWQLAITENNVARLASGDYIRAQSDPANNEDLARKSYVDASDLQAASPTLAAYTVASDITFSDHAAQILVDDTWEPSLLGALSGRMNSIDIELVMDGTQTVTLPVDTWITDAGSAPSIGDGDIAHVSIWQFSDDGTVVGAAYVVGSV